MAKFTLVLLVIVALQGCYGASLRSPRLNDLEQVVQEYATAMKDIKGVISFIANHLSSIIRDYNHEISEIVETSPIYSVIAELRETITKLESQTDESKDCFNTAWAKTTHATEDMKRGLDNCMSDAHTIGGHVKSILEIVDGKATHLQSKIADEFHRCKQETGEEAVKCLKEAIEPLKQELADLKLEVTAAHKHIHHDVDEATRNMNTCVLHLKDDIVLKTQNILEHLNQCIETH